jgi:hypothetical protein
MTTTREQEKFQRCKVFNTLGPFDKLLLSFNVKLSNLYGYMLRKKKRTSIWKKKSDASPAPKIEKEEQSSNDNNKKSDMMVKLLQELENDDILEQETSPQSDEEDLPLPDLNFQQQMLDTRGFPDLFDGDWNNVTFDLDYIRKNNSSFEFKIQSFLNKYNLTYSKKPLLKSGTYQVNFSPSHQESKKRKLLVEVKGSPQIVTPIARRTRSRLNVNPTRLNFEKEEDSNRILNALADDLNNLDLNLKNMEQQEMESKSKFAKLTKEKQDLVKTVLSIPSERVTLSTNVKDSFQCCLSCMASVEKPIYCTSCKKAPYCNRTCRSKHRASHKRSCDKK